MALPFLSLWLPNHPGNGNGHTQGMFPTAGNCKPFHPKLSTLLAKKVDPFSEKGQPFLRKRSTLLAEKVYPFGEKVLPF